MIPQEMSEAVTRSLREAFGVTEIEDIRPITKGRTSALVFRVVVRGSPFLLRIIMRPNAMIGPARHFTCMRSAAEAGLAPHVWYTSVEDGISITDFVEEVPFPASEALVRMPAMLRTLHALPSFSGVENHLNTTCMFLMNQGPAVDGFIQKFQEANILSTEERDEIFGRYAQMAAACTHHESDMVSSHNDLFKPDNILFDGDRVWLVDWEAAFLNDRYADLAVVANMLVTDDAEERAFLQEYFGQPPDQYQMARFFLMLQVAHLFYAMVFLLQGSYGKPLSQSKSAPGYRDFQQRFWTGEIDLVDSQTKTAYGRVHLEQFLEDTRQARFDESLGIVSNHHAYR